MVASEVKSLAVQTAKATEEIAGQIAAVQGSSTGAVEAIRRIVERMQEINQFATAVAASVRQQDAATGEISQNVASAADGTKVIVSVLTEVASAATQTRASAQTLLTASKWSPARPPTCASKWNTFWARWRWDEAGSELAADQACLVVDSRGGRPRLGDQLCDDRPVRREHVRR